MARCFDGMEMWLGSAIFFEGSDCYFEEALLVSVYLEKASKMFMMSLGICGHILETSSYWQVIYQ